MGFSKKIALEIIPVAMTFRVKDERAEGATTETTVVHTFRLPTAKERESWRNAMSHIRNGKPRLTLSAANQVLWRECIKSVSGYDDLPGGADAEVTDPIALNQYFSDEIGKLHIDSAIGILLAKIGEEEAELEKK